MTLLNTDDVRTYIRLHHEAAELEKQIKPLKDKILAALVAGASSPSELPLLCVNRVQRRPFCDWRAVCLSLLTKIRSKKSPEDRLAEIEAAFPVREVPALHLTANPQYVEPTA